MFEHRLSKLGKTFFLAICLLLVGGLQQSCKDWLDDYKYDDSEPDWLGASIYAFLQEGTANHSYKNYVELIDSLGEAETLAKTGSKTLFVADDAAFERFFNGGDNVWGVKSVAEMTKAQQKYLFYNTMLNNAILLDMMPNTSETSEGDCISRETEFNSLDSVPVINADSYPETHPSWPGYNKYWEALYNKEKSFLVDMTPASLVHFFGEYLKKNAIKTSDINFIFSKGGNVSKSYADGDVFLYGNKLVDSDVDDGGFSEDNLTISCKNGYIYRMDDVLLPPLDMASELRKREDTRIFSHLLDRFCIPVYNSDKTSKYREYKKVENDSVYSLKYFTKNYTGSDLFDGKTGISAPDSDNEVLDYDPAESKGKKDLYALLVPKDDVLYEYFADEENGAGNFLIKHYAPEIEVPMSYSKENVAALLEALDSIPQISIATFLNNLMQESFAATVPSKFDRITDDANDDMNIREADVDECFIANNGVLYLLNKVFSPAQFSSVAGPVDINDNMRIMRKFINSLQYNYYLLAMDADYSLIIPDDGYFVYYDPFSFDDSEGYGKMTVYHYDNTHPDNSTKTDEIWYQEFNVDKTTMEISTPEGEDPADPVVGMKNEIATELLEYLIIVHDKVEPRVTADRMYYSTKGYGTIKVVVDETNPDIIKFYGGEQLEKGLEILASNVISQENGVTYCTVPTEESTETLKYSSVPTPPTKSIYQNMYAHAADENALYHEFFTLCYAKGLDGMLNTIYQDDFSEDTAKLYSIFYTGGKMKNVVPFFNTYHYTVYVPSNESIRELYNKGLPTWDIIDEEVENNPKKAMSMIRLVNNFLRYHFQDQSVYHDKSPFYVPNVNGGKDYESSMATSLINSTTGRFYELKLKSDDTNSTILIQDEWAKNDKADYARIITTPGEENITWNVMCRDRIGTKSIETSSFAVIQPIDRALLNENMFGYDSRFARFAANGHQVDTMYVAGGQAGDAGFSADCYLVAKAGRVPRSTEEEPQPADLENKEVAYLMTRIDSNNENWNEFITRELLVRAPNADPIMITREGYRVIRTEDTKNDIVSYAYYTETDDKGDEYIIKLNNAGEEIARELYKEPEVETPETDEDSSNGETSDEE